MREKGFYWVLVGCDAFPDEDEWTVGEWHEDTWSLTGSDEIYCEAPARHDYWGYIKKVGTKITREEA